MIIVGTGPGAWTAAMEASGSGLDVLLVEPERPGPAPMPPRLRKAVAARLAADALPAGLLPDARSRKLRWESLVPRADRWTHSYLEAFRKRLAHSKVQLRRGAVSFHAPHAVRLSLTELRRAPRVLIASSGRLRRPSFFPFDDRVVCDEGSAFRRDAPRHVIVVGASAPGCEVASLFASLDVAVTLIDRRTRLLRALDRDLLKVLHTRMQAAGIDVVLGEEIVRVDIEAHPREPHAVLSLASGRVDKCDRMVVCAGRIPNTEDLALDRAGVETDPSGLIVADEFGRTSAPGVYAIGEVSGFSADLGTEIYQARVAVNHAQGRDLPLVEHVPNIVFTVPEIATVGLPDEVCIQLGMSCVVGMAPYPPVCTGPSRGDWGLLKLVVGAEDRTLLGVHMIGYRASETLQLGVEFLRRGARVDDLVSAVYPAPSLSEAYREAAVDAIERLSG